MKKHGKYIALSIIGIIAILIAVNWRNIKLLMNIISSEPEDAIKITEIELWAKSIADIVEKEEKVKEQNENENETNNKRYPPKDDNKTIEKHDELYAKILTKYNTKLEALQQFEGQLDDMVRKDIKNIKMEMYLK